MQARPRVGLETPFERTPQIVQLAVKLAGGVVHAGTGREQCFSACQEVLQVLLPCQLDAKR
jgi:hypothetical protein